MTRISRRLNTADDEGSALVLAMMVVLLVGALLAAVLDFVGTGLTVAPKVRNDRNEANYVQGAVDGAINKVRGSSLLGTPSGPACPDFTPEVPGADIPGVTGSSFRVSCSVQSVTDPAGEGIPQFAIHALGSGIRQITVGGSNDELVVDGGVYSKGVIEVTNPPAKNTMTVYGSVTAEGGCSGPVYTTDLLGTRCTAADALPIGNDPGYGTTFDSSALAAVIASPANVDPKPVCRSDRVEFAPGYYSVTPTVLAGYSGCAGERTTWHFDSGAYYFDYAGVWDIGLRKVVFGELTDPAQPLGKACQRTVDGAHLVFGGESQVATTSSAGGWGMEVCGPANTDYYAGPDPAQRIAVYGLTSANDVSNPPTSNASTNPGAVAAAGGTWVTPDNGRLIDNLRATSALGTTGGTASLRYSGLSAPKGSSVTKIELRFNHLPVAVEEATLSLVGPGIPTGNRTPTKDVKGCTTACTWDITADVTAGNRINPSESRDQLWRYLEQVSVSYSVKGLEQLTPVPATAVDGMEVVVTHKPPALRPLACPTSTPSCTFFESKNNPNVHIHGTVYTPSAKWAVRVHGSGESIFDRGVVLSSLDVVAGSSSKQTSAPFQLPHGPAVARQALFRGFVDPDAGGPQAEIEHVRACVTYTDVAPNPATPDVDDTLAFPGYRLSVDSWVFHRTPPGTTPSCPAP